MDHGECGTALIGLAARAREGDGEALERLLTQVHVHLHGFFLQWLHHRRGWEDVADDLTQEALIKCACGLRTCDAATDASFLEWCRRIAVNAGTDYLRKMRDEWAATVFIENLASALDRNAPGCEIATDAGTRIMLRILHEVHESEPEETQLLLWQRVLDGESWAEAGEAFGIAGSAAKRRYERTRARLRRAVLKQLISLSPAELAVVRRWMARVDVGLQDLTPEPSTRSRSRADAY